MKSVVFMLLNSRKYMDRDGRRYKKVKLYKDKEGCKMDKEEEYVVHGSKMIYLFLGVLGIGMVYCFYWILNLDANDSVFEHRNFIFVRLVSVCGIVSYIVCIIIFIIGFCKLKKDNKLIILTKDAIRLNHLLGGFRGWIGWEEIVDLNTKTDKYGNTLLEIYYIDKNSYLKNKRKSGILGLKDIEGNIHQAGLGIVGTDKDPEEVIKTVFEYWENYKKQTGQAAEPMETIKTEADIVVENPKMEVEERETAEEDELDLMEGVLEAADSKNYNKMRKSIEIKRKGKNLFNFKIHSLSREEISKLDEKYTAEEYSLQKIYLATIDIDREKIWDDEEIQNQLRKKGFSISTGIDVIQAVLEENEIKEVNAKIDKISGIYASELSKINE